MDDSNKPTPYHNQSQNPLGMNAFGPTVLDPTKRQQFGQQFREQFGQHFGQNVRLAMACIEAAPQPIKGSRIASG